MVSQSLKTAGTSPRASKEEVIIPARESRPLKPATSEDKGAGKLAPLLDKTNPAKGSLKTNAPAREKGARGVGTSAGLSHVAPAENVSASNLAPLPIICIETICDNCKHESTRNFKRVWYMCEKCCHGEMRPKTYEELK